MVKSADRPFPSAVAELAAMRTSLIMDVEMTLAMETAKRTPAQGTPISQRQAGIKYGVTNGTIIHWVQRGWVTVIVAGKGRGSKTIVDEHDVAVIALTHDVKQGRRLDRMVE